MIESAKKNRLIEMSKLKKSWKKDMKTSVRHHEERHDLLKHILNSPTPKWGDVSIVFIQVPN